MLEGDAGTRVITGSANFSERAFSGAQNESYVCFDDDPDAWEHFNAAYEKIRDKSTTSIIERAQIDGEFDRREPPRPISREEGFGNRPKSSSCKMGRQISRSCIRPSRQDRQNGTAGSPPPWRHRVARRR